MRPRPNFLMFMDPAEKYPVGSTEWAGRMSVRVHFEYARADACGFKPLVKELRTAVPGKPWLAWPPDRPWGNADRWSRELVGLSWTKLMGIVREIDEQVARELEVSAAPDMAKHGMVGNGRSLALPTLVQEDARLAREMREHGFDPAHPLVIRPLGDGYQVVASARDYSSPASSRRRWSSSAL